MELTSFRIAALAVCVAALVSLAVMLVWRSTAPGGDVKTLSEERDLLVERVRVLEEELRKKDLALTLGEKGLDGTPERFPLPKVRGALEDPSSETPASDGELGSSEGPLTVLPPHSTENPRHSPTDNSALPDPPLAQSPPVAVAPQSPAPSQGIRPHERAMPPAPSETREEGFQPTNFNALDVVATRDARGGALSFRLVKDQPNVRFTGYLFIFVEMIDKKGETKLLAYPEGAKLGEEELPADFRSGESVTFKYNTRVELPYGDQRTGAALGRVSILLYGEDGAIVFQRSFDRTELKVVGAKPAPAKAEGADKKPVKKRQAL